MGYSTLDVEDSSEDSKLYLTETKRAKKKP